MAMNTCSTCKWWSPLGSNGECHGAPPSMYGLEGTNNSFPLTTDDDFCGQHTSVSNPEMEKDWTEINKEINENWMDQGGLARCQLKLKAFQEKWK